MGKSKFIQKSVFLAPLTKKLKSFTLPLLLVMIIAACNKDEPLSDRDIIKNLAGDWEYNHEHLLGMWKPVYSAYTKDGKGISGREVPPSSTVEIRTYHESTVASLANYGFNYSSSSYFTKSVQKLYFHNGFGIEYSDLTHLERLVPLLQEFEDFSDLELIKLTNEELIIYDILAKARGLAIRDDNLFIYFIGIENINLLILKKN